MANDAGKRIPEWKRSKLTGRGADHTFLKLRHDMLRSARFQLLSGSAVKVLLFLASQFNGRNNGDLSATASMVSEAGLCSGTTAAKAIHELVEAGFVLVTRHGHKRRCSLYAVTWLPVDECPGKGLEVPSQRLPSDAWKTDFDGQILGYRAPESGVKRDD